MTNIYLFSVSSTNNQKEPSPNITTFPESEFFKLETRSNNKSHSMELSLSTSSALSSRSHHQAQNLVTDTISMSSSHHHLQMASQQQPNQLLASNAHNGGQVHELPPSSNASICHGGMDPSTSTNLVDHHMLNVSDHPQTTLSQHVSSFLKIRHISTFGFFFPRSAGLNKRNASFISVDPNLKQYSRAAFYLIS